ncbi:MAG: 3-5 exonuclease, PolB [Crocinitomicaceae bacterium]|jgi:DNA polymerase elongation subunit (family B)|nr:3-5 exonuclease, PolB [Crocinitomicaceae bacterium]
MLEKVQIEKILFLDIETVPQVAQFSDWDQKTQELFTAKNRYRFSSLAADPEYCNKPEAEIWNAVFGQIGGIQAEFGKIVCISVGFVKETRTGKQLRLKSFYHEDEETLLKQFCNLLNDHYNTPYHALCGHNAKEFDIPYICRRLLINGMKLPSVINIAGKKPWEIAHLDTLELWKFGDYKAFTSLSLLCHVFGIPTPKDDISGADVARVYYENDAQSYSSGLERVKSYCEKDVVALVQLFLRMRGDNLLNEEEIYLAES